MVIMYRWSLRCTILIFLSLSSSVKMVTGWNLRRSNNNNNNSTTTTTINSTSSSNSKYRSVHHPKTHPNIVSYDALRKLQTGIQRDFVPLSCNQHLSTVPCVTWTSIFGTSLSFQNRVTIPCGVCVMMDLRSSNTTATPSSLHLNGGLDIIGKLIFPDEYLLHVTTTMIVVQGELIMTATKPVDGIPSIKFTMIGNDNIAFTPIGNNAGACRGAETCNAGKKGIIVAGGTLSINGLPHHTPSWTRLYDVVGTSNSPTTILVPSSVHGKWNVGAEILITPHTTVWNATQVRRIQMVQLLSPEYVALQLNASIIRPTTMVESNDFAVEIALLSRNIVFEGGTDSTSQHGGHLMIMNTPNRIQTIQGMELINFGQQGTLGRYPIHFHFCNDVAGSEVSKNTIRQSNQRCVVVHGSNKLRIEENVAFDTKGHCYMTEDGIESDNVFIRNLGARTGIPTKIIPNLGTNGDESDSQPATFWISAPSNSFVGNVAAGSQHSGYWFDPRLRGDRAHLFPGFDPQYSRLIQFRGNVAHSNTAKNLGAIRMYTPGYFPDVMTPLSELKVYRNNAVGIFIHRCQNIRVDQSLFADNYIGIDIDRAEGIEVTNTAIVGSSPSYRALMLRQANTAPICERNERVGLDLHTWQKEIDFIGAIISNVSLSGFDSVDRTCAKPRSIRYDNLNLKQGLFEFYSSFEKIQLAEGVNSIDMCVIDDAFHDFAYLVDLDGSFRPNRTKNPSISSLVASDNKKHMVFVNASKCEDNSVGCYSYCSDTCFRSIRYYVTGIGQDNYTLKVCSAINDSLCSTFKGGRRGDRGPHEFIAHLPSGQRYNSVFLDDSGVEIKPFEVREVVEKTMCPSEVFSVSLKFFSPLVFHPTTSPPTRVPTRKPSPSPSSIPSGMPSSVPTDVPSKVPTRTPVFAMTPTINGTTTIAWINEFHYENIGEDKNEFIEIAHNGSIVGYQILLYDGRPASRDVYGRIVVDSNNNNNTNTTTTSIPYNGIQYTVVRYVGIQNGGTDTRPHADGIALIDPLGRVVQFLSYEGSFIAINGTAAGIKSTDIGVHESINASPNHSLQLLQSSPNQKEHWAGPIPHTMGQPNRLP